MLIKSFLIALLFCLIQVVAQNERMDYIDLLDNKEMCTSHIYCKSRCCLEPRKVHRKKRGNGRHLRINEVEETENLEISDEVDLPEDKKR